MSFTVLKKIFPIFLILSGWILIPEGSSCQDKYKYRLDGIILDHDSRQALKNVSIMLKKSKSGTISNENGEFSLTVNNTNFTIVISSIGYITLTRDIDLSRNDTSIIFYLKRKANVELDSVVINARRGINKVKAVQMGVVTVNPEMLKRAPLVFGEADIIRGLTLQAGVTSTGEASGGFNVRGGNADQNLVLLDGATLFNTAHLLGFYTSVTPDAIQDVTLYKGSMPAQYGGRISSLLNLKTKTGNPTLMEFRSGISPVSLHFFASGPIAKNKLTFTGGIRLAYPDLVLNQFPNQFGNSKAFFYDALAKVEYNINSKNKLSITGYRSFDKFRFDTLTFYDWQSNLATLNYESNFSRKLSLKINANYSQFISGINGMERNMEFRLNSAIAQKQAKAVFLFTPGSMQKIEFGTDYIYYHITPGDQKPVSASSAINPISIQKEQGREMAAFISDEIEFTDRIALQLGIRYVKYDYLGPKNIYSYEANIPQAKETITDTTSYTGKKSIKSYGGFEPRASIKIGIDDNSSIKLSYHHGQQFLHLISNTISISPVDFWKLSDSHEPQQIGDQYAAGFFRNYNDMAYEIAVEGYYKTVRNMVEYKDGAILLLNPYIETSLLNARGKSYGVELSIAKNKGKFSGQLNYTYSKSLTQVITVFPSEAINNGEYYPANIDRPHNLAILTKTNLPRGWSFNANFIFMSGRPTTYPDGNYPINNTIVANYSRRNHDRLPAYHRLDIGFSCITKRFPEQRRYSVWNFSFYNVYAHENAYSIYFKRQGGSISAYQLSVIGSIVPSISWNYYF